LEAESLSAPSPFWNTLGICLTHNRSTRNICWPSDNIFCSYPPKTVQP